VGDLYVVLLVILDIAYLCKKFDDSTFSYLVEIAYMHVGGLEI